MPDARLIERIGRIERAFVAVVDDEDIGIKGDFGNLVEGDAIWTAVHLDDFREIIYVAALFDSLKDVFTEG